MFNRSAASLTANAVRTRHFVKIISHNDLFFGIGLTGKMLVICGVMCLEVSVEMNGNVLVTTV